MRRQNQKILMSALGMEWLLFRQYIYLYILPGKECDVIDVMRGS